ncbi:MAG: flagellar motor switch protein FliN [Proteobacteria bacterium]|nr:MAG: flagellar motor switch protein FliN [Pseudomonadota bacterium]
MESEKLEGKHEPRAKAAGAAPGLAFVADVPLRITVQLGQARMRVRDVLALERGSVVELDRAVGEPADVLVNGRVVARADLTVVDERLAIRIVEVVAAPAAAAADA